MPASGAAKLWVPKTYATRRYSWITPPERSRRWTPELIQVGDAIGKQAQRRGVIQACRYRALVLTVITAIHRQRVQSRIPAAGLRWW